VLLAAVNDSLGTVVVKRTRLRLVGPGPGPNKTLAVGSQSTCSHRHELGALFHTLSSRYPTGRDTFESRKLPYNPEGHELLTIIRICDVHYINWRMAIAGELVARL
jgi:hypothetical protein